MTAKPGQPCTPDRPRAPHSPTGTAQGSTPTRTARDSTPARTARGSTPARTARGSALRDLFGLVALPLVVAVAMPAAMTGGGGRRWFGGRSEGQRAQAQAAKDAAATAFYELDTAQRDMRLSMETIAAVDDSPAARRAAEDFAALGHRIDACSHEYIQAVDSYDLDRDDLDGATAAEARTALVRAKDGLDRVRLDLERFEQGLGPLLGNAETRLARLAPAVEQARQALLAASEALDAARATGLGADDLAARLAALGPELTRLNEGAGRHGVPQTLSRAEHVAREAEAVRSEARRLPERAAEIDRRLVSLRTRAQALTTRSEQVEPVLSELRRRFTAACWQDLQPVPARAHDNVRQAEGKLAQARSARDEQRWADAAAFLSTARALLNATDEEISAAGDRLTRLNAVAKDPGQEVERTRFAIRDAQRLAMAGRSTPDPRHARPLDDAVARLDRAVAGLEEHHPDYWHFLTETQSIRRTVSRVVGEIREERGAGASGGAGASTR